jgi:hypothetical protein
MLKLIMDGDIKGYSLSTIKENLSPQRWTQFQSWIHGQTVGVYENEPIVYAHDFERFMKGLPSPD